MNLEELAVPVELSDSPAVESLNLENARQSKTPDKDELETGLEDTLPASDPVSLTIPTAERSGDGATPVEEALSAVNARSDTQNERSIDTRREMVAMRSELVRMRGEIAKTGTTSIRVASAGVSDITENFRRVVRRQPLVAFGIASVIGFVWGRSR
ncbi:hypothetical protein MRS76_24655 [Rhizobiaceae bacterium n13]|uniref:Uncharacterized protein n=1 Tax=Ferirhizobium litorale TaxID=2927786 RepID=A0AAE3U642_9HYPH|nr:hypothetical protein [Fererhizobium litorale]MDI7865108.1 hypothetical protein [Fererhizobium litorale]MDI7925108.1 hypothetical protein [Fererhizobium litorale]